MSPGRKQGREEDGDFDTWGRDVFNRSVPISHASAPERGELNVVDKRKIPD